MEQVIETPNPALNTQDTIQSAGFELPNWDNFKCHKHPSHKLDVISINDEDYNEIKLLCLKCVIEDDHYSGMNTAKKLLSIKDLVQTCFQSLQSSNPVKKKSNDGLEDQFLNFLTNDYIGKYEKHLESQYHIVDLEIKGVIENLNTLRDKYKDCYAEELVNVRVKAEDIKKKIKKYLDENTASESHAFSSLNQVLHQFNVLQTNGQFCEFLKGIYLKSKDNSSNKPDNYDYTQTLKMLEDFKVKATNLEEKVAELFYFQEMNKTIKVMAASTNLMFRKPKGLATPVQTISMKFSEPIRPKVEHLSSSFLTMPEPMQSANEDIFMSDHEMYKPCDSFQKSRNKKRSRFSDIDSQSLRNIKKEIDEKENTHPNQLGGRIKPEAINSLHDWINRRITGYLIFQNTVKNDPQISQEKQSNSEMGVHFNHVVGLKWKHLSQDEKDEYKKTAKEYRKRFREQIHEREGQIDFNELLEDFDWQIKKIKKE